MDNLIDSIESSKSLVGLLSPEPLSNYTFSAEKMTKISQDTKKKCSSIKNLSFGSLKTKDDHKEVKITSV